MIKHLVSKNKRRYVYDGYAKISILEIKFIYFYCLRYDLDLTYVTDRIIAMGFPSASSSLESMFRNSVDEVQMFLEEKHKNCYKVYNLCSERYYDAKKFQGRVSVYPFDDHNPPEFGEFNLTMVSVLKPAVSLGLILAFCRDVEQWLLEHPDHVAAVHCKAGKGRTGLMICSYLLYSGIFTTSSEVLEYYGTKRTSDCKGVTIPSQRRYVDYFAVTLAQSIEYTPVRLLLTEIILEPPPHVGFGHHEVHLQYQVLQHLMAPFTSTVQTVTWEDKKVVLKVNPPLLLNGDVKIVFSQKMNVDLLHLTNKPKFISTVPHSKLFHFWVNTCFINLRLSSDLSHHITSLSLRPEPRSVCPRPPVALSNRFDLLSLPELEDEETNKSEMMIVPEPAPHVDMDVTSVRLSKHHIDKASKDNTDRFPENFSVTLLVMKPQPDVDRLELCPSSVSEWSVERKSRLRK